MEKLEQLVLEHGNIEMLCCYAEQHLAQLSDEMKNTLSSFSNRLNKITGKINENIYNMTLDDFFKSFGEKNRLGIACYPGTRERRAKIMLEREGYQTLQDILKIPRPELLKIKKFGSHCLGGVIDAIERAGLDPYMVIK